MDKNTLSSKARTLKNRKDLFNLLNEIKADLLGDKAYPFTWSCFRCLCNPKLEMGRYRFFDIPKKSGGFVFS